MEQHGSPSDFLRDKPGARLSLPRSVTVSNVDGSPKSLKDDDTPASRNTIHVCENTDAHGRRNGLGRRDRTGGRKIGLFGPMWDRLRLRCSAKMPKTQRFSGDSIVLEVVCGDMVRQETQAIVRLTDRKLRCIRPSSRSIAVAAGHRLSDGCDRFLKEHKELKECEVMHTEAGNLSSAIRYVVHVAEPTVNVATHPERTSMLVEDMYYRCLRYANDVLRVRSLALPFVDLGPNFCPPVITMAACKAVMKFDQNVFSSSYSYSSSPSSAYSSYTSIAQRYLYDIKFVCENDRILDAALCTFNASSMMINSTSCDGSQSPLLSIDYGDWVFVDDAAAAAASEDDDDDLLQTKGIEKVCWREKIKDNYHNLQLKMILKNDLEGELRKRKVFTPEVLQACYEISSTTVQNKYLLDVLLKGKEKTFDKFCEALESSRQKHIVTDYLSGLPKSLSMSAIDRQALQKWKIENIETFHNKLVLNIISDCGLLALLRQMRVFTDHQLADLESEKHQTERNEMMLDWLKKSSERTHSDFCQALETNNQSHLVDSCLLRDTNPLTITV